jgi:hypothetical protein
MPPLARTAVQAPELPIGARGARVHRNGKDPVGGSTGLRSCPLSDSAISVSAFGGEAEIFCSLWALAGCDPKCDIGEHLMLQQRSWFPLLSRP